ncbi:MAG: hypothetical protein MUE41_17910 [Gemmatimonadaceae bacterium]|jgi:hypothetical protein|nr:hypothetical protein [Gemmatimonadaceae bacterium]
MRIPHAARGAALATLTLATLLTGCSDRPAPVAPPEAPADAPTRAAQPLALRSFGDPPIEVAQVRSFGTGGKTEVTDFIRLRGEPRGARLGGLFLLGQNVPGTKLIYLCERQRAIGELTDFYISESPFCLEGGIRSRLADGRVIDGSRIFVDQASATAAGYDAVPLNACVTTARDSQRRARGTDFYTSSSIGPILQPACVGPVNFIEAIGRVPLVLGFIVAN